MAIIWRDAFSVGDEIIDRDHRYLFSLVNTVELALRDDERADVLRLVLDQLVEYTADHFAREEQIQLRIQYPKYVQHKVEHQRITREIRELQTRFAAVLDAREAARRTRQAAAADPHSDDLGTASGVTPASPVDTGDESSFTDQGLALSKLIRGWIIDHVMKTDQDLKPYLARG